MNTWPVPSFGNLLKRFRGRAGKTQEELAEQAGLSARGLSDLERGVISAPRAATIRLLADALHLTHDERIMFEAAARRRLAPSFDPISELPSEVRTFLIIATRDYTAFTAEHGEQSATELVTTFVAWARGGITAQGGQIIETIAGEVRAVFGSARQALRAAVALQASVAETPAGEPARPRHVSIGLDAGEIVFENGIYRGAPLSLAAQLCRLAQPGEVLASSGVVHLARKTEGLTYLERGEVILEDSPDPIQVVQVFPTNVAVPANVHIFTVDPSAIESQRSTQSAILYREAQAALAADDRTQALEKLQRLLILAPMHPEASALMQHIQHDLELAQLYAEGREHYGAGRWQAAMSAFQRIHQLGGAYRDVAVLLAAVRGRLQQSETQPAYLVAPSLPAVDSVPGPVEAHYRTVIKSILDGSVVPFLGTDVNLCGRPPDLGWRRGQFLPSANELASYLAERFDYPWSDRSDLVRVSQYIAIMTGPGPLYASLRQLFGIAYPPTPVHHFLAGLPALLRGNGYATSYQLIVTATYDDVLESAFQMAGEPYDLVSYVAEGEYRGRFVHYAPDGEARVIDKPNEYRGLSTDQRTVILKMHGALHKSDPEMDSFVITEDQHISYLSRVEPSTLMPVTLLAKLRTSHLLFLGHNLRDWNQRVILHRLWGEQKLSGAYKSWAVQLNQEAIDQEFWGQHDVSILPVPLDEYVNVVSARVQAIARLEGAI